MGAFDQISAAIGSLEAQAKEGAAQRDKLFERLEDLGKEMRDGFAKLQAQLAAVPQLEAAVKELKPKVETHDRIKNRAIGYLLAGGGGTAGLLELVRHFFRGNGG